MTPRPPRLDARGAGPGDPPTGAPGPAAPDQRVLRARLAGPHERLGVNEVRSVMRRVALGHRDALLGLDRFEDATEGTCEAALRHHWGWRPEASASWTDPAATVVGWRAGVARVLDVARRGGRIAFATGRPASLLPTYARLVRLAVAEGADLAVGSEAGSFSAGGRARCRLWWPEGVAAITDGDALIADAGIAAAEELLFSLELPDLIVADRGFAARGVRAGIEVVALADLDSVALGLTAARGYPITLVPLQDHRPPAAYAVLAALATEEAGRRTDA